MGLSLLMFFSKWWLGINVTCNFILQKYMLIDTAGIRRRAAVASGGSTTEALSVNRAFRAIHRSDVVALVIEAMPCITEQVIYHMLIQFSAVYLMIVRKLQK